MDLAVNKVKRSNSLSHDSELDTPILVNSVSQSPAPSLRSDGAASQLHTLEKNAAFLKETSKGEVHLSEAHRARGLSGLERLPPEVRRSLLAVLDLPQLKSLVHASPVFHQQYLYDRSYLLRQGLVITLGPSVVDAYAVSTFSSNEQGEGRKILEYLGSHSTQHFHGAAGNLDEGILYNIAASYLQIVKPLTDSFALFCLRSLKLQQAARPNLGDLSFLCIQSLMLEEEAIDSKYEHEKPHFSKSEMARMARATYRFQLLCKLADTKDRESRAAERLEEFLNLMEPWEIEELLSFYQFAYGSYDGALSKVSWDLHYENPKFDDQGYPPTPDGAFDLSSLDNKECLLEGITLGGIVQLHSLLFKLKDREEVVAMMQQKLTRSYIPLTTTTGFFGESEQYIRQKYQPNHRHKMQEDKVPCSFQGDSDLKCPPLAWTLIWENTYSNLYGSYIPDYLRSCGYVFWDAATLDCMGSRNMILGLWKQEWDEDPRDSLDWN